MRLIDLTGQTFNRLTVISRAPTTISPSGQRHTNWHCICECGNETVVWGGNIKNGSTKSCGCLNIERAIETNITHGCSKKGEWTPEYRTWASMIQRCTNPNVKGYKYYGGRGIAVCKRWRKSFTNFLTDMGERPSPKHTIDRIDGDGNYEPSNSRWTTQIVQQNNRRNNRFITYNGIMITYAQWSRKLGGGNALVSHRLRRGWTEAEAVSTPVKK